MFTHIKPIRLCFSGGGIKTISYIGALEVLQEAKLLISIREYLGVSAGAFVAFCLAIGYSLTEMLEIMNQTDFGEIRSIDPEKLFEYDEHFGIDDGEGLVLFVSGLLKRKGFSENMCFKDLDANISLRIFATDLNELAPREFSRKLTPQVRIVDALRASMALPFYFTPVRDPITGNLLTDGGVLSNYPIVHLTSFEAQSTIGFVFDDHENHKANIESLLGYLHQVMSCFWINENISTYSRYAKNTIIIPCASYNSWNFEVSDKDKEFLVASGKRAAKNYLESFTKSPKILRRRSVS
jgi:predicted acylesterase/phospholipase RssA